MRSTEPKVYMTVNGTTRGYLEPIFALMDLERMDILHEEKCRATILYNEALASHKTPYGVRFKENNRPGFRWEVDFYGVETKPKADTQTQGATQ